MHSRRKARGIEAIHLCCMGEIDSEVAAANSIIAAELDQGALAFLPDELRSWFGANREAKVSPTPLGVSWYAHQQPGRLQLIDHQFLAATGFADPATQPGNNIWTSRAAEGLTVRQREEHLASYDREAGACPITFADGVELHAPDLPWQAGWTVTGLFSNEPIAIRMPSQASPWVASICVLTATNVVFRFVNGDEMLYEGGFPVFDERVAASGNKACLARVSAGQGSILAPEDQLIAAATSALVDHILAGEIELPDPLRAWFLDNEAATENPPSEFSAVWRCNEANGVMELVDRDLLGFAVNTSGHDLWGPGARARLLEQEAATMAASAS